MFERPVLALCTPRTGERFIAEACGMPQAIRWTITGDLNEAQLWAQAEKVATWGKEHPDGVVVSLGDDPSLVHAMASHLGNNISSLQGACLKAILATFDKAYCRHVITKDLGRLQTTVLRSTDRVVPWLQNNIAQPVMVKPVGGCASMGIVHTKTGEKAPIIPRVSSSLSRLCATYLSHQRELDDVIAVVEEYVPPNISRVSVDGWVKEDGTPVPFAISDNCYVEGEPERFCHQMFPSHLSKEAQEACWNLYRNVVSHLVDSFALCNQFCDVEMFVYEDEQPPRAEVMEVNCRVHPNIAPILKRCMNGGGIFEAHLTPPNQPTKKDNEHAAGALYYLWGDKNSSAPDPDRVAQWEEKSNLLACIFDSEGPKSGEMTCWGWLYVFGAHSDAVRKLGEEARSDIMSARG